MGGRDSENSGEKPRLPFELAFIHPGDQWLKKGKGGINENQLEQL